VIYIFIKIFVQLYNRVYFRKIYIHGTENIPKNVPVFLAANHPNGFLDGTIISSTFSFTTHAFVRGDVFNKKWSNFLLRSLKLIPIFRVRDGAIRKSVGKNNRSYDQLYSMFLRKKLVLIFSESDSIPIKQLRSITKGTARIVLDMENRDDGEMNVSVVPTGLNYSFYRGFGKELHLNFAVPIHFSDSAKEEASSSENMNSFTSNLHEKLSKLVIHVPSGSEEVAEIGFGIIRASMPINFKHIQKGNDVFMLHYRLAKEIQINEATIGRNILDYQQSLQKEGLKNKSIMPSAFSILASIILFLPSFFSWTIMWVYTKLGISIANAMVRKAELYDSVVYGVSVLLNIATDVVGIIICGIYLGPLSIAYYLIFRWLAIFFFHALDHLRRLGTELSWYRFKIKEPEKYKSLIIQRNDIIDSLHQ
jgi:1-acyl-sn-glycerol-3-phosphate acyltransferase